MAKEPEDTRPQRRSSGSRNRASSRSTDPARPSRSRKTSSGGQRGGATSEEPTLPQPAPGPGGGDRPERVLRRSREDRVIAGVAGGLGRYLGIDSVVLRLAIVILAFAGGSGVLLYILAWILIPEEKPGEALGPAPGPERRVDLWVVVGVGLIGIGAVLLINQVVPGFDRITGPLILVALGVAVLVQGIRR